VPESNCLVLGDFKSNSESWGYEESDKRGDKVENWQIDNNLILLSDAEYPPTFYSRRCHTTSNPDLAFATDYLYVRTTRSVLKQLGPIKLTIDLNYRTKEASTLPRWN
jgi:hypothetical protein